MPDPTVDANRAALRKKWDKASLAVEAAIQKGRSPKGIKAARTRMKNAHRAYWEAVHAAWADIENGMSIEEAAEAHEVEAQDIGEIVNA